MPAEVIRRGLLDMQVCVPENWTNEQVITFANTEIPCGTENGWQIRRQGDDVLAGADERATCSDMSDHVHIMLDA